MYENNKICWLLLSYIDALQEDDEKLRIVNKPLKLSVQRVSTKNLSYCEWAEKAEDEAQDLIQLLNFKDIWMLKKAGLLDQSQGPRWQHLRI